MAGLLTGPLSRWLSDRSLLTFYALMLVPILHALYVVSESPWRRRAGVTAMVFIMPVAVQNTFVVFEGYAGNAPTHRLNHARLLVLSREVGAGEALCDRVILSRLPDERYAETMPYQRALIETWMKKCYALPSALELQWK